MLRLFRFDDATPNLPAVDAYLDGNDAALAAMVRPIVDAVRALGPDVREVMHDGMPTFCVEDAAFAYVAIFRAHANVGFFQAVDLPDPAGLLEGTGKRMRHVKLRPKTPPDAIALRSLLEAAYSDVRARL